MLACSLFLCNCCKCLPLNFCFVRPPSHFGPLHTHNRAKPAGSLPQPAPSAGGSRQRSLTGRCGMVVLTWLQTQVLSVPPRSLRRSSSSASSIRAVFVEISVSFCWRCRLASKKKQYNVFYLPIYLPFCLFVCGPQASCERFREIHLGILTGPSSRQDETILLNFMD